ISGDTNDNYLAGLIEKKLRSRGLPPCYTSFKYGLEPGFMAISLDIATVSVKALLDSEAQELYDFMLPEAKAINKNLETAEDLTNPLRQGDLSDDQRKAIISIARNKLKWKPQGTFNFILRTIPELRDYLSPQIIKGTRLNPLYNVMSKKQGDKIIKRMEKIHFAKLNKIKNASKKEKNYSAQQGR